MRTWAVTIAVMLLPTFAAAVAQPVSPSTIWPPADPNYRFSSAPGCDQPRVASTKVCSDQMAAFSTARSEAAAAGKRLVVVFGATWCPSCKTLAGTLPEALTKADLNRRLRVIDITLSTVSQGKIVPVSSGEAVRADLMRARPEFKPRAIPFFAIIDPVTGRTSARNLDDLDHAGNWSQRGLAQVFALAEAEVLGGQVAPGEPSWLTRKWRRWFGW